MSILIVEDSPQQGKLLQHILKRGGFADSVFVESPGAAFDYLGLNDPSRHTDIDLILMDLLMPEMDGIAACRLIKAKEHLNTIPVIMVTSASDLDSLESAFEAGAMDYIIKPVNRGELLARVRSVLKLKQQEEALRKSEARYRAVVEDQTELICRFAPDGTLTFINEAYCRYFGKEREELIGRLFMPSIPDEDRCRIQLQITLLCPENPVVFGEHRLIQPDDEIRWLQRSDRAIFDDQGRVVEYQSVGRDITERKRAEEALHQAYEELERRVEERTAQLQEKTQHLEEVNTALKILLRQREVDKEELEEAVLSNVKTLLAPYIEKMKNSRLSTTQATYLDIVESHLNEITSPFIKRLSQEFLGLSPMEIRVADLVREGRTTKDIAELLSRSEATILFHRDNIRNKLGLKLKKVNLRSYLQSFR